MVIDDLRETRSYNLKRVLKEKRISSAQLAALLGSSPSYVSGLLRRMDPNNKNKRLPSFGEPAAKKISKAIGVDVSELHKPIPISATMEAKSEVSAVPTVKRGGLKAIKDQHIDVIEKFKNKVVAKQINELLVEIETLDPDKLLIIYGYLQSQAEVIRRKREKHYGRRDELDKKALV